MSHGIGVAAQFAQGPRADIETIYGRFTTIATPGTATALVPVADGNTSPGFSVIATAVAGVFQLVHPKVKMRFMCIEVSSAAAGAATDVRQVLLKSGAAGTDSAVDGILTFNTIAANGGALSAPVAGSVFEVFGLIGF